MGEAADKPSHTEAERFSAMLGRSDELTEAVLTALGDSDFDRKSRGVSVGEPSFPDRFYLRFNAVRILIIAIARSAGNDVFNVAAR